MSQTAAVSRPAAVSGLFYPAEPDRLAGEVDALLAEAQRARPGQAGLAPPKALIVPHAGYVYSGPTAAAAYARLLPHAARYRRVVLLGPAHRHGFRGLALPAATAFVTPLGSVPLDTAAMAALAGLPGVSTLPEAHADEHALEVQLPFLQRVLGNFTLVPLVVGLAPPEQVAAVLRRLWGGTETLIVISSDLSHYHDYATARRLDLATAAAIERADVAAVASAGNSEGACGRYAIAGLLTVAADAALAPTRLALCSSGDTAGPRDRVVGYGAWEFTPGGAAQLTAGEGETLLDIGRGTIAGRLGRQAVPAAGAAPVALQTWRPCFVSLYRGDGELRGCIGSLVAERALADEVARVAVDAAFRDPRFDPLSAGEYEDVKLEISVLTPLLPLPASSRSELLLALMPGEDGLLLRAGGCHATFLPQVWDKLPAPDAFLDALLQKGRFPTGAWAAGMQAWRYRVEEIAEGRIPAMQS
jgi:AmmeMemoRadiSam system protein B/AmmeMemoRadiSam system protein A